jgi:hypothetical protein
MTATRQMYVDARLDRDAHGYVAVTIR